MPAKPAPKQKPVVAQSGQKSSANGRVKLSDLQPQVANVNRHSPHGLRELRDSIQRDGIIGAITVAADGEAFDGSARLETLAEVMPGVEIRVVDTVGDVQIVNRRTDIPNAKSKRAKRLGYSANAVAAMDWNPDGALLAALAAEDDILKHMAEQDAASLRAITDFAGSGPLTDAEPQMDRAAELNKKWRVKTGDLFTIGSHRLLCGDSTVRADVERVMGGEKAALFCTDPPYGVAYGDLIAEDLNRTKQWGRIINDDLTDEKLQEFLEAAFTAWLPVLLEKCAWYLWHAQKTQGYFTAAAAAAAGVIYHRQIVWVKPNLILGRGHFHWRHELCLYGWSKSHEPPFYAGHNKTTVWEFQRPGIEREHPTQKPLECFGWPMEFSTRSGEVCAEPFAGSGSQYVAGQNLGRRVFGMEIEPKYCAVILQRMTDAFPGLPIAKVSP